MGSIGVLGSLVFGLLTYLTNLYSRLKKISARLREVNNASIITKAVAAAIGGGAIAIASVLIMAQVVTMVWKV